MLYGFFRRSPKPSQGCAQGQGAGISEQTRADEVPRVPPRPSEEEIRNSIAYRRSVGRAAMDANQQEQEVLPPGGGGYEQDRLNKGVEGWQMEKQEVGECAEDDSAECVSEAGAATDPEQPKEPGVKTRTKRRRRRNPFMPHVSAQSVRSGRGDEGSEKPKCLSGQLNELRLDVQSDEDDEDPDSLMEWWSSGRQWEPMSKDEGMTEKQEAKAFALTAEKLQRGVRVFNRLFSERAEALWQHVVDLNLIADGLDRFNRRAKVAQITGGSTSAVGGVATIAGLALAPVTMGTSLIVTAVGLGVAAAGGLTSASASISNTVHGSLDRKKVERIVKDFQSKMADITKCTKFIKRGVENLQELKAPRVKKLKVSDNHRHFSEISHVYEDGAMAGKAVLINANEISRLTQVTMATGSAAARAVQVAAMATGILTGLFVAMDVYFVAKDSHELRKGAKSELAGRIREVAEQLHQGLVELNAIREELRCSERSTNPSTVSNPPDATCSSSGSALSSLASLNTDAHTEPQDHLHR